MSLIYNASFDSTTRVLSLLDKAGNVISSCEVPSKGGPLTFTATEDNSSVKLTKTGTVDNTYEVNTGSGWVPYTFDTVIYLNKGQSCKWRCTNHPTSFNSSKYVRFRMTGSIEASGEVYSMLSSNLSDVTTLNGYDYAFYFLFRDCTSLIKAPELPATTLAEYCYSYMFCGCKSLTSAPKLPATTLARYCYDSMFQYCTALTSAPELPATTLARYCYNSMFYGCTSLTQAPALPATHLTSFCYRYMFSGCTSLTQAPALPATDLANYCYQYMFSGCTSLKEVRISANWAITDALDDWLLGVSATGDFYCDPNATIFPTDSASGIPSGWTRRNIADYPSTP